VYALESQSMAQLTRFVWTFNYSVCSVLRTSFKYTCTNFAKKISFLNEIWYFFAWS